MGRKKTKRVAIKKAFKPKLEKAFACPFCNHESTIECKLDRQRQIGSATCRICSAGYQTVINYLSEPVDVYGEWIDAIEAQGDKEQLKDDDSRTSSSKTEKGNKPLSRPALGRRKEVSEDEEEEEEEEFEEEDEEDRAFVEKDTDDELPDRDFKKQKFQSASEAESESDQEPMKSAQEEDEESEAEFTDSESD